MHPEEFILLSLACEEFGWGSFPLYCLHIAHIHSSIQHFILPVFLTVSEPTESECVPLMGRLFSCWSITVWECLHLWEMRKAMLWFAHISHWSFHPNTSLFHHHISFIPLALCLPFFPPIFMQPTQLLTMVLSSLPCLLILLLLILMHHWYTPPNPYHHFYLHSSNSSNLYSCHLLWLTFPAY